MTTTFSKALVDWQEANGDAASAAEVKIIGKCINKLDNQINCLVSVKKLSLSTNCIDKMVPLGADGAHSQLEILSLGRNLLKKISGLENVGGSLQQLWLSYNQINNLDGLSGCHHLEVLYMTNNEIASADELQKLKANPKLRDVQFKGNPFYGGDDRAGALMVLDQLQNLDKVDGRMAANIKAGGDAGAAEEEAPAE